MGLAALQREDGHVGRVLLTDPVGRNLFTVEMRDDVSAALREAFADPAIRAIAIGPETGNFSLGGDLKRFDGYRPGQETHAMMRGLGGLADLVGQAPKPVVAAVQGHCIGAAAGLALLCDVVVMGRGASLGFPFIRLGLLPDFGVSWSLPRRVGPGRARQILLNGASFDGPAALTEGLADETVEDAQAWEAALTQARRLAKAPAAALLQLRLLMRDPPETLQAALEAEALHQAISFGSAEMREGVAALSERRTPDFIGGGTA